MPSHLDFIFWLIFHRFLLTTSTPESQLNTSPLTFNWLLHFSGNIVLGVRFWCQLGSMFVPKIHQHSIKHRSWKAPIFWLSFGSICSSCWLDFGSPGEAKTLIFAATVVTKTKFSCWKVFIFENNFYLYCLNDVIQLPLCRMPLLVWLFSHASYQSTRLAYR